MKKKWAIKVVWLGGEEEFLKEGAFPEGGSPALFSSRERADVQRDFMLEGMSEECQSINVVPAPKAVRKKATESLAERIADLMARWDADDSDDALCKAAGENDWDLATFLAVGLEERT